MLRRLLNLLFSLHCRKARRNSDHRRVTLAAAVVVALGVDEMVLFYANPVVCAVALAFATVHCLHRFANRFWASKKVTKNLDSR